MLQSDVTFEDLTQGILDIYDVDEETVKEDIRNFWIHWKRAEYWTRRRHRKQTREYGYYGGMVYH